MQQQEQQQTTVAGSSAAAAAMPLLHGLQQQQPMCAPVAMPGLSESDAVAHGSSIGWNSPGVLPAPSSGKCLPFFRTLFSRCCILNGVLNLTFLLNIFQRCKAWTGQQARQLQGQHH